MSIFTTKDVDAAGVVRPGTGTCGVYGIGNIVNGKWYIGSSKHIWHRWKAHISSLRCGKHRNNFLQNAWNKHGEGCFEFIILEECLASERMIRENIWMGTHRSLVELSGYNLKTADPENTVYSEKAKIKMRLTKSTPEWKAKASAAQMGHKTSQETKDRIREAHIGQKASAATREKMSKARLGKKHSEEWKLKQSVAMNTSEYKDKMSSSLRVQWKKPEFRDKVMAGRNTPECKAKIRSPKSDKHRENMRASWVQRRLKIK